MDTEPTYLYGVFDGNDGCQAANFALQRMAAEILLDSQLIGKNTDDDVKEVLRYGKFIFRQNEALEIHPRQSLKCRR